MGVTFAENLVQFIGLLDDWSAGTLEDSLQGSLGQQADGDQEAYHEAQQFGDGGGDGDAYLDMGGYGNETFAFDGGASFAGDLGFIMENDEIDAGAAEQNYFDSFQDIS